MAIDGSSVVEKVGGLFRRCGLPLSLFERARVSFISFLIIIDRLVERTDLLLSLILWKNRVVVIVGGVFLWRGLKQGGG